MSVKALKPEVDKNICVDAVWGGGDEAVAFAPCAVDIDMTCGSSAETGGGGR